MQAAQGPDPGLAQFLPHLSHHPAHERALRWERLSEALEEEKEEKLEGEHRPYFRTQYHLSHVVNVAMGLKTPGVINMFRSGFKEQGGFGFGWSKLMKYHGVGYGMFSGDEHLNGSSPTQGTSCARWWS